MSVRTLTDTLIRAAAAIVFIASLGFVARAVDRPEARYQFYPELFKIMYASKGPIDLAFIGPSGSQVMIDAKLIAGEMERRYGRPITVIDLSKSWYGVETHAIMARDLLDFARVNNLAIQYLQDLPRNHEKFFQMALWTDLVESAFAMETLPLWKQLHLICDHGLKKVVTYLTLKLSGAYVPLVMDGSKAPATLDPTGPQPVRPEVVDFWTQKLSADWEGLPDWQWSLTVPTDAHNRYYYDLASKIASEKGVNYILYDVPHIFRPQLSPSFAKAVAERHHAQVFFLTKDQIRPLYPKGFADHGHANAFGSQYQSRLFGELLNISLASGRPPS